MIDRHLHIVEHARDGRVRLADRDPGAPDLRKAGAERRRDLLGKRALGYLNWTRNRHKYQRREVLDVLVSDLQAQTPDHIAITGDLVNLALEAEFAPSRAWLESVGAPDRVTVIPGNHDAYVRATAHRFAEAWGSYLDGDATPGSGVTFPSLRRRGPLALISVSSAVPTPPLMATGWLGESTYTPRSTLKRSARAASFGKCSEKKVPGTRVAMGANSPRNALGASGFGSKLS